MDLKIEIRKLYALHQATIRLDHAITEVGEPAWRHSTPSHFVYAFFTFNSIYAWDWETSFKEKKAMRWTSDHEDRVPRETAQFKAYLRYADAVLSPNTVQIFREHLADALIRYGVAKPVEELRAVNLVNATKELRNLATQLPQQFEKLELHAVLHPLPKERPLSEYDQEGSRLLAGRYGSNRRH